MTQRKSRTSPCGPLLIIMPNPMGDAILATPALRHLRQALPDVPITLLARPVAAQILADHPLGFEVLNRAELPTGQAGLIRHLQAQRFSAAIIMPNSFRTAWLAWRARIGQRIGYNRDGRSVLLSHAITPLRLPGRYAPLSMLDYYGYLMHHAAATLAGQDPGPYATPAFDLELGASDADETKARVLLDKWQVTDDHPLVTLVPGGAFGGSKWWPVERFGQLAQRLRDELGARVAISCAPGDVEQPLAERIAAIAGNDIIQYHREGVSLGVLKALIRHSRLMVSNDTGPCHIAAAFNAPLVTLFGPTDPRWTATGYSGEIRLRQDVDCGPCQQQICPRDHRCLQEISVEHVMSACKEQWSAAIEEASRIIPSKAPSTGEHRLGQNVKALVRRPYHVYDESYTMMPDGCGLVHASYLPALRAQQMDCLDGVFSFAEGQSLHKPGLAEQRERIRIKLDLDAEQTVTVYLKRFGARAPGQVACDVSRTGRMFAPAAYDITGAWSLAQAQVPVPRPIAWGQQRDRLGGGRSFMIMEELPNADALERLLPRRDELADRFALLRDRDALIEAIGRLVRRMHVAGYCHRDLYLSHFFLGRDVDGNEQLSLIDLTRVFRPRWRVRRWRIKDLAQLVYSARPFWSIEEIEHLMRIYLDQSELNSAGRSLLQAVMRKAECIARHDKRRQMRLQQDQDKSKAL